MLAIVCPGQGSQKPGLLAPWLELPGVRERLELLSEAAGLDLVAHGTTSDEETIKDTAVAQPLIVGAGVVTAESLLQGEDAAAAGVGATGGHSVGEITAAIVAGVLAPEEAMAFVRVRGEGMAAASAVRPTGMSAVLGGDPDDVLAALEREGLTPANVNGAGQVVAAGTIEELEALRSAPPARAKVVPLSVAGAFHTSHMAPAVGALAERAATMSTNDPGVPLLSNADGRPTPSGAAFLDSLVAQVTNPVRWDLCMATLGELGVTGLVELAPSGTLVGLAKRALKGVELLAVKEPADLDAARRMVAEHGAASAAARG